VNSNRVRSAEESELLRKHGSVIAVYELQGKMAFGTTEAVVSAVTASLDSIDYLIFDLKHVVSFDECACRFFDDLFTLVTAAGNVVIFTNSDVAPNLRRFMKAKLGDKYAGVFPATGSNDLTLEWCENQVLASKSGPPQTAAALSPADYELLAGLDAQELEVVAGLLERRTYIKGETIIHFGYEAAELFFLARGSVSVNIELPSGSQRRLATFSAGMAFGEMAVLDGARRSANIIADEDVECDLLKVTDFHRLTETHPRIKVAILTNLGISMCGKLRKANRELSVFDH
jgi:glutaminase